MKRPIRPSSRRASWLLALALIALAAPTASRAQGDGPTADDLREMEAQREAAWAAALDADPSEPLTFTMAWSTLLMSEVVLERVRGLVTGEGLSPTEARERALARWASLRPDDAGPEIFRTFDLEDQDERLRRVLDVLDRFPGNVLAVSQAAQLLRGAGDSERAAEVLESFVDREPAGGVGYRLLAQHHAATGNETRFGEVLRRWAGAAPDDPSLIETWLGSDLPRRDPEATDRILARFFATGPDGPDALGACTSAARSAVTVHREAARACLARLGAGSSDEPSPAAEQAAAALVEAAAAEGDWAGLLSALDGLPPEARRRAAIGAAYRIEVPAQCDRRIALLRAMTDEASADPDTAGSVASALSACSEVPGARAIFLDLLRETPPDGARGVVGGWARRVNGLWQGDLPVEEAAAILERRLAAQPDAQPLLEALSIVYRVGDLEDDSVRLLADWQRRFPDTFRRDEALELAERLALRGDLAGAIEALERQLDRGFDTRLPDELWSLLVASDSVDEADAFAERLAASPEPLRRSVGHLLAARTAVLRGDLDAAEKRYWAHLEAGHAGRDAAAELLALVAERDGAAGLPPLARRICSDTGLGGDRPDVAACASDLLARAGRGEAAGQLLAEREAATPDDVRRLEDLARTATEAGQWAVAERALRRIVELDPENEAGWTHLGLFFEKRGAREEVERLLSEARNAFARPPYDLLRCGARSRLASGDPQGAIDLLREARAGRAPGSDPAWIDAELREAYGVLGRQEAARSARSSPQTDGGIEALRQSAEAGSVDAMVDFARRTLTHRASGPICGEGLRRLEAAARTGRTDAAAFLGKLLLYGRGECVAADAGRALGWLEAAASAGESGGAYDLGLALLVAEGEARDTARAVTLLQRSMAEPDVLAAETLAWIFATGVGVERDSARARRLIVEAARLGSDGFPRLVDAASRTEVLRRLVEGGRERLETLSGAGDPFAMSLLATMLYDGTGVSADRERAVALAREAAEAGEAGAMRTLSHALFSGEGGAAADPAAAVRLQRRCAEAGDSFCMMFLSQKLMRGELVEEDPAAGLAWLARAGEAGNWWAIGDLGNLFDEGWHGLPRDEAKAAHWKRIRARLGDPQARGWLLYHGHPVD